VSDGRPSVPRTCGQGSWRSARAYRCAAIVQACRERNLALVGDDCELTLGFDVGHVQPGQAVKATARIWNDGHGPTDSDASRLSRDPAVPGSVKCRPAPSRDRGPRYQAQSPGAAGPNRTRPL
jgi:hypothetical protein